MREHAEAARLYRRLTRIALDAPIATALDAWLRQRGEVGRLDALCEKPRFGPMTRSRLKALIS